jgi:hypothetical protein
MPFRVALIWSDYPGTMRAARIIVNDLNLTVISPTGTEYKGSVYSGGQSTPGGVYDSLNVEECTRLNTPDTGTWTIKVKARNVPQGPQPFALAAIGMFTAAPPPVHDVGAVMITAPVGEVDSGETVTPKAIVENFGDVEETFDVIFQVSNGYADTVEATLDAGAQDTVEFLDWDALVLGWFATKCTTLLAADVNHANDMLHDSCHIVPIVGVEEGRNVPGVFFLEKGRPNPFLGQTAIHYGLPRPTNVDMAVYSIAGEKVRTLVRGRQPAGFYQAVWNGRDDRGRALSDGVYYCRFVTATFKGTKKLIKAE